MHAYMYICKPLEHAGQGEFSAVGFSYGEATTSSHSGGNGPMEDLGEEGSSDSESGQWNFLHAGVLQMG